MKIMSLFGGAFVICVVVISSPVFACTYTEEFERECEEHRPADGCEMAIHPVHCQCVQVCSEDVPKEEVLGLQPPVGPDPEVGSQDDPQSGMSLGFGADDRPRPSDFERDRTPVVIGRIRYSDGSSESVIREPRGDYRVGSRTYGYGHSVKEIEAKEHGTYERIRPSDLRD